MLKCAKKEPALHGVSFIFHFISFFFKDQCSVFVLLFNKKGEAVMFLCHVLQSSISLYSSFTMKMMVQHFFLQCSFVQGQIINVDQMAYIRGGQKVDRDLPVDCGLGHGRSPKATHTDATGSPHCSELTGLDVTPRPRPSLLSPVCIIMDWCWHSKPDERIYTGIL